MTLDPTILTDAAIAGKAAGALGSALQAFKGVKELVKSSSDSTLKGEVSELQDKLIDLKEAVSELQDENAALRKRMELRAEVKRTSEFGYYFVEGDADPLCPLCYEKDGKLIHLGKQINWNGGVKRVCGVCLSSYWEVPMQSRRTSSSVSAFHGSRGYV